MKIKGIALLTALFTLLPGCATPPKSYDTSFFDVFDTYTTFSGYAGSEREFQTYSGIVYGEMLRLHHLFDIYNDYEGINNLKTVNDNAGVAPVLVDPVVIDLLDQARQAHDDTGGTMNIALGAVFRIWHRYRTQGLDDPGSARLPSRAELSEAAGHTDIANLIIDREASTAFLADPLMSLDVGSVAKGYAAQAAVDLVREAGMTSGILNAGGNVCVIGHPGDGRSNWSVAVQDPKSYADGGQQLYDTVYVSNSAVVSSGDYQRFYVVDGVAYHHIIDPETLAPATRYRAVTIIHPDSTTADILSTAAFILPYPQAKRMVEEKGGQGVWILADGTALATEGYDALSKNAGAAAG